jgi:hypothetical protein
MFKFALESNVVVLDRTPKADKAPSVEITAEFSNSVNEAILDSIIFSLIEEFEKTGLDQKSINNKLHELINTLHVRQDVGESYFKWKERWDPTYNIQHPYIERIAPEPNGYYEFHRIIDSVSGTCDFFTRYEGKRLALNDHEKELISRLETTFAAFQKARDEFYKYTHDCAIDQFNQIMTKYGDAISKVNPEWYEKVSKVLKISVERLEKRRREANAEATSAVGRNVSGN